MKLQRKISRMDDLPTLHELLGEWRDWAISAYPDNVEMIAQWERSAREHLPALLLDNSHLGAEELETLAEHLSPGGVHNGGAFIRHIMNAELDVDPRLLAAIIRENWKGGKAGFQFLPDPAVCDLDDYDWEAESLYRQLRQGHGNNPRQVLTAEDREFYDSLPDRFSVYRGCSGVTAEVAGMGLCWCRDRQYAEWFATRGQGAPVLVSARVSKNRVALAFQSEGGEIVVRPKRSRELVCRPQASRPNAK